jgi:protein gp37
VGDTKIEWAEKTWNPIRARRISNDERGWYCEHVSEGCRNCYAERMNRNTYFGNGLEYKPKTLSEVDLFLDEKILQQPLHWSKPQNVFPCSMTDLFGRWVKDEWLEAILNVIYRAKQHTFQGLTKRADRMLDYISRSAFLSNDPLPNLWLGVSCEDQKTADERIPLLLQTPAAVRWISAEPLLGPVDLSRYFARDWTLRGHDHPTERTVGIDWAVVGGESGPGARSLDLNWIKSIVSQCQQSRVPVFVKQLGVRPWWDGIGSGAPAPHVYLEQVVRDGKAGWQFDCMKDRKGGDMSEWPEDLRVREYPKAKAVAAV